MVSSAPSVPMGKSANMTSASPSTSAQRTARRAARKYPGTPTACPRGAKGKRSQGRRLRLQAHRPRRHRVLRLPRRHSRARRLRRLPRRLRPPRPGLTQSSSRSRTRDVASSRLGRQSTACSSLRPTATSTARQGSSTRRPEWRKTTWRSPRGSCCSMSEGRTWSSLCMPRTRTAARSCTSSWSWARSGPTWMTISTTALTARSSAPSTCGAPHSITLRPTRTRRMTRGPRCRSWSASRPWTGTWGSRA
mmetsp:Transcript_2870/g.6715  ORF Transcript_2870/g.6715 Transcript_2870/m.6715 type:complete len:249 (+) Transcript_2870:1523-2269(+)